MVSCVAIVMIKVWLHLPHQVMRLRGDLHWFDQLIIIVLLSTPGYEIERRPAEGTRQEAAGDEGGVKENEGGLRPPGGTPEVQYQNLTEL